MNKKEKNFHLPLENAAKISDSVLTDDVKILRNRIKQLEESEQRLQSQVDKLAQDNAIFHQILDNIPDSLFIKDKDSKFTLVNMAWARNRNIDDVEKAIGKTDFDFFSYEKARGTFDDEQRIIATGVPIIGKIEKKIRLDGEIAWTHLIKVPIKDGSGKIIGTCGMSRDITDIKHTEDTLEKERNLLRTIIDALPDSIYVKDTESRFLLNNRAHIKLCGSIAQEELLGKTDLDVFRKDFAARSLSDEQNVLKTGHPMIDREEPVCLADGNMRWLLATKVPIRDSSGRIVGLVGISRDITVMKETEAALEKERNLLRTIMDTLPDSIYVKDTESRFLLNSRAHIQLCNASCQEELLGKTDLDVFKKDFATRYFSDEQVVLQTGRPLIDREEPSRRPDGSIIWLSTTKVSIRDSSGKIVGLVGISRDITKMKEAEAALENERNLLRIIIDTLPDSIFVKDTESRFIINNKAHIRVLNAPNQEMLLGKTDFDIFDKELATLYFADEQIVLQAGRPLIDREEPGGMEADGTIRCWLSTTKVPILDSSGHISGLVGISRDITERKHFEEALQKANDELERRVEERTRDLKSTNEQLQTHINQLKFLNTSSYELGRFFQLSDLVPAILQSFISRFQHAEAALSVRANGRFRCMAVTAGLDNNADKELCEQSLTPFLSNSLSKLVLVEDWSTDDNLKSFSLQGAAGLPVYLAIPMFTGDHCGAVIQIFTTPDFLGYFEYEHSLFSTLAAQAAACLANAAHYQEAQERARLQGELDTARLIQQRFTPQEQPDIPFVLVKGVYYPAYEIGGDYLDYFQTDTGEWVIVIADVCGKGIPAALFMTMLRSVFRVEARNAHSARDLICRVNESMRDTLEEKNFVTALCLMINKDSSSMTYARAGHPKLIKLSSSREPENIQASGLALGLLFGDEFARRIDETIIPLVPGDRFLIYTDGLTEATDPEKNNYGLKRLTTLLADDQDSNPEQLISLIMKDIKVFTQESPYHDDLTILSMQVTG